MAPAAGSRVRRARALVAWWEDDEVVAENFLAGTRVTISPPVAGLLARLGDPAPRAWAASLLGDAAGAAGVIDELVESGLLLHVGSEEERLDADVDAAWEWGMDARFFHYATRSVPYEPDMTRQRASLADHAASTPPPPVFARRGSGPRTPLPGSFDDGEGGLWDALHGRRTERGFAREPVSLGALATVVRWTWGATERVERAELGPFLLKTSPSGGARHPIECYVAARRVAGVEPGVYHYSVQADALDRVGGPVSDDEAEELFAHQPWVRDAAALFFMSAVVERSMWKYKHSHAYRVLLLDAGHLGQTFHLVCTALGLAPFTSSAKDDPAIERRLGLDGVREVSLYAAAMGVSGG